MSANVENVLIERFCECLTLVNLNAFEEALTRIGANVPGKQVEFYYKGKSINLETIVAQLLLRNTVYFASFSLTMSDDLNYIITEEIGSGRRYRPDLKQGFIDIVVPLIESVCALVIQTVRNFDKPFNYR